MGVPKETRAGENRVSLVPEVVPKLAGLGVVVQRGAGEAAGFSDQAYEGTGAVVVPSVRALCERANVILKVMPPTPAEADILTEGSTLVSFLYPQANLEAVRKLAARRVTSFAMELIPRISRAQPMDALSSQATIAGYKAVILAADSLPKLFPMLMTAAGTISPAKVFVLGAGVAGLQAIAVARRLGGAVEAYDVRPAVKEQVASLGAKFVELPIEAKDAQDAGGYAKAQSKEFYGKQQELLAEHVRASDVVITTALVPSGRAPILVTEEAVRGMRPGSVIVDLAAEQGGNCALTVPGETAIKYGVTIHGPLNLPSTMAPEASRLYSRNITSFLMAILKNGEVSVDVKDELIRAPLVTHSGEVVHPATRAAIEGVGA